MRSVTPASTYLGLPSNWWAIGITVIIYFGVLPFVNFLFLGHPTINPQNLTFTVLALMVVLLTFFVALGCGRRPKIIALVPVAVIVLPVLEFQKSAIQSWDFLSFWGPEIICKIERDTTGCTGIDRHPLAVAHLVSATYSYGSGSILIRAPWIIAFLLIFFSIYSCSVDLGLGVWKSVLCSYLVVHGNYLLLHGLAMPGYIEPLISVLVVVGIFMWCEAVLRCSLVGCGLAVLILSIPCFYRNTGFVYSALALVACFGSELILRMPRALFRLLLLYSLALLGFLLSAWCIFDIGSDIEGRLVDTVRGRVRLFGYWLTVEQFEFKRLVEIFKHNSFMNQSFGILAAYMFLLTAVVFRYFTAEKTSFLYNQRPARIVISGWVFVVLTIMVWIFSMFTERGMMYALPGADTGGSRFLIVTSAVLSATIPAVTATVFSLKFHDGGKLSAKD